MYILSLGNIIIIVIMLSRVLLSLQATFARSLKAAAGKSIPIPQSNDPSQIRTFKPSPIPQKPALNQHSARKNKKSKKESTEQNKDSLNKQGKQLQAKLKRKVKSLMRQNLTQKEILAKFGIEQPSEQQTIIKYGTPQNIQLLKQNMIIEDIIKKYQQQTGKSTKQAPVGSKYEQKIIQKQQQQLKQARIMTKLRSHPNIHQNLVQIPSSSKLMEQKYSHQIIQQAEQQKNRELAYFKELMSDNYIKQNQNPRVSIPITEKRLKKGETYAEIIQKDKAARTEQNLIKRQQSQQEMHKKQLIQAEKKARKPKSQQLVQFEDQDYYKQKAIQQFQSRQLNKNIDKQLYEAGQKDIQQASDISSILIDQYQYSEINDQYKKQLYEKSSFGKIDAKMTDLHMRLKKHGIDVDLEEIKNFKKEILFDQKKSREQQQQYQKYLMKKEKKKQMKKYFQKIHAEKLRDDLDFEQDHKDRYKDVKYDPLDIEGNMKRAQQLELERKATLVAQDTRSQHHFKKTQKNMSNFITSCFYENFLTPNQMMHLKIKITALKFNEKKTVVNVFWTFADDKINNHQIEVKKMQRRLTKTNSFFSGKMTQLLGLRYGPDIRFHFDATLPQTIQIRQSLQQNKQQIINYELNELKKKGHIRTHEQLQDIKSKLEMVADDNIKNYHNRGKLMSKKYLDSQKKVRYQANNQKKVKMQSQDKFWQSLNQL